MNTGDGKGKTTAAAGTVLGAVARGWKVAVIQFVKPGRWRVGEERMRKVRHAFDRGVRARRGIDY